MFGPVGLLLGAPLALLGVLTSVLPYVLLRLALLIGRPSPYRIALTKLLGGALLFGATYGAIGYAAMHFVRPSAALGLGLSLVPLLIFTHRYVIDLRLYRFGLRKNIRKLWQRSRYLRLRAERQLIQYELAELRRAYLAQAEPLEGHAE